MASSRVVQARVPGEIQTAADAAIQASGLTVSNVGQAVMTCIAHDGVIPRELFVPSAETQAALREVKRGQLRQSASVDALFDDLNAES